MSNKRVILFVSNDLTCDSRVHKMAMTLFCSGYRVLVVGRRLRQSLPLCDYPYETKRLRLLFTKGPLFYAVMNARYFIFLLFHRFDIATANDLDTLLGVFFATKIKGKKIVYDSHEYFTEVPELLNRPKIRNIWLKIEKHIFPKLTHCITVCESIANAYREKYNVKIEVIRNVPYRLMTYPQARQISLPSKNVLLYQGAVNVDRGIELIIETMKFLDDACLLIVGDGDILLSLKQLVAYNHLEDKIIFAGKTLHNEVPAYTQLASIGLSLEEDCGLSYRYALPNKLFDYIQAGKPVLVSNLPEMTTVVNQYKCGEIVKDRTPHILAEQIQSMLDDTERMQRYHAHCLHAAMDLCWENEQEKVILQYEI